VDALSEAQTVRELISQCLTGEPEAQRCFQQTYGELIYGYPMRVYRTPPEEAGDFYVFAFDQGRIFRRVRTFEGRAPFRAYLLGFVLDDLVLEWKRGQHHIDTISIEDLGELADPAPGDASSASEDAMNRDALSHLLADVEPAKAVVLKLLYVEDAELGASEIGYIADVSGRSVPDVLNAIEGLRGRVREREAALKNLEDSLDAVQAWIDLYERRRQRIASDLAANAPNAPAASRLQEEQREVVRKIERRRKQQAKLVVQTKRRKVTTPYKEIADVLHTTVGNIGSQIARLRQELKEKGWRSEEVHDAQ
jgi:DNA-directed RNA polymerase specialized sigma24 family protein